MLKAASTTISNVIRLISVNNSEPIHQDYYGEDHRTQKRTGPVRGIKALARQLNIWDLVNPDLEAEPEYTTPPKKVGYKDINPQATSIQDLTKDQLKILRFLKEDYKE
ncbi:hypothetical protein MauCBS54593_005758 [Microsporum audouinii]